MTTENLRNTMATVDAMQTANKEMKRTYGKIDLDKIEDVQDDMEDLIERANEVQETLGRSYGVPDDVDESDLQAELDALEDDLLQEGLNGEAEGAVPSYLQQDSTSQLPDFIDEAPAKQENEVSGRGGEEQEEIEADLSHHSRPQHEALRAA